MISAWLQDSGVAQTYSETVSKTFLDSPIKGLKQSIAEYLTGEIRPIDIWDIEIVCMPEVGSIKMIVEEDGKKVKKQQTYQRHSTGETVISSSFCRKMANYCSIGIDARIGLGFDRNRSTNRFINKMVYAWEGLKKFVRPAMNMQNIIERMEVLNSFEQLDQRLEVVDNSHEDMNEKVSFKEIPVSQLARSGIISSNGRFEVIDRGSSGYRQEQEERRFENAGNVQAKFRDSSKDKSVSMFLPSNLQPPARPTISEDDTANMTRLSSPQHNINRHLSLPLQKSLTVERCINGYKLQSTEIFRTGDKKDSTLLISPINLIALNIPSYMGGVADMWNRAGHEAPIKSPEGKIKLTDKQEMGDGILEFLSFTGNLRFGIFERLLRGGGKRIAQGGGPFLITFKQSPDPVGKPLKTYAQIDGEYMQLVNPLYYRVSLTPDLPNGKINGLFKKITK